MANAHDVAAYILGRQGPMTAMKLQKLVYYCQAWSLVWDERALFEDEIEAWANGPVVPVLYQEHKGMFRVRDWPRGDARQLDDMAMETIDAVLAYYGDKPLQWLSDLTHMEAPWRRARINCENGERRSNPITHAALFEYYGSLDGTLNVPTQSV